MSKRASRGDGSPLRPTDAQRIRDLMSWGGLTEEDAARELGVAVEGIRAWRAGKSPPPRMAILALERLVDKQRKIDTWI
jgi:DNA-binding transcriptional regulator YiaG